MELKNKNIRKLTRMGRAGSSLGICPVKSAEVAIVIGDYKNKK